MALGLCTFTQTAGTRPRVHLFPSSPCTAPPANATLRGSVGGQSVFVRRAGDMSPGSIATALEPRFHSVGFSQSFVISFLQYPSLHPFLLLLPGRFPLRVPSALLAHNGSFCHRPSLCRQEDYGLWTSGLITG
ncbi:hypothetical protein DPEC_G00299340 [Dallia pectoralis]|uniref:Uncharacterized protein n=1 Tax=Dallia pectoralis TaxID=75939 RepID=A0ACC2FGG2_DALPE|nr:hypothetical protein DPEC_G00299340 [Dallia pectoralis]